MSRKTPETPIHSKRRTGTARAGRTAATVTLRTPTTLIREKSKESASTSASHSGAKKSTRATETSTDASSSTENSRPLKPRVDIGPKAYKVFRNKERLVIRFSVEQGLRRVVRGKSAWHVRTGNWFVWDMDTGKIAAKTSKTGYTDKQEAVRIAREYRDKYGAYVRFEF